MGSVIDVEIDLKCGKILALIVPECQSFFSFKRAEEYRIPLDCISKIGEDMILVTGAYPIHHDSTEHSHDKKFP